MIVPSYEKARFNMVEQQVRPWEVLDAQVLELIGSMPRDHFVPDSYKGLAYADIEIPLGDGQKMMFPRVEGRLLQALDIQPSDNILEVGTGSGYLTACLAKMGNRVISQEINPTFTEQARQRLAELQIENVELRTTDSLSDDIESGRFDAIAITGSLPEMPETFKQRLNIGGRLFVVTGQSPVMTAFLVTRTGENEWQSEPLFETDITPLTNAPVIRKFEF
ncbi:protein-L-isoaspartate O-methyltransferase family protein [Sedimenticola selenatireducens]|uniref:Protein-L-isoaspartate O-methyltransferase n=1 Tax=Sedimenticola selenatireducens TaxID=191960 RepID=A0A2N6CVU0_9GAMM|nr:protein-L-isoaspartate O-methyltransferase [Sedimenticola selenatireducens]PLX61327.1 MAG: protein-L-isoaspartate O-methyltransferase [Sedimenticola selenatireducens]